MLIQHLAAVAAAAADFDYRAHLSESSALRGLAHPARQLIIVDVGRLPATVADQEDTVSKARGKRVAANSVYRILDLFVGTNLARRVESANAYVANQHPGCLHDCIFLICDTCGQATHIDDDKLSGGVRQAAEGAGFAEVRPVIEVRGRCGDCS